MKTKFKKGDKVKIVNKISCCEICEVAESNDCFEVRRVWLDNNIFTNNEPREKIALYNDKIYDVENLEFYENKTN